MPGGLSARWRRRPRQREVRGSARLAGGARRADRVLRDGSDLISRFQRREVGHDEPDRPHESRSGEGPLSANDRPIRGPRNPTESAREGPFPLLSHARARGKTTSMSTAPRGPGERRHAPWRIDNIATPHGRHMVTRPRGPFLLPQAAGRQRTHQLWLTHSIFLKSQHRDMAQSTPGKTTTTGAHPLSRTDHKMGEVHEGAAIME